MPLNIEDMKIYLRVDADDEDSLIEAQMLAADKYISGKLSKTQALSGVNETGEKTYVPLAEDPLYQQCVKLIVVHWFENRSVVATGTIVTKIQHTVDAILTHIEGCGDYI
jgi:uncharacterized phage protein (predicted DNA packaging)